MEKPLIFLIDDDPQVLHSITRDLKSQYEKRYKIISNSSAHQALETIAELRNQSKAIAIFISDQRMPEMQGIEFLKKAMAIFPNAKRVLLTAYSDTQAAIEAINHIQLDYYLMKPWNPAGERLYPVLDDLLSDWQANYRPEFKGLKLIGFQYSPFSHKLKDYLAGNLIPYQWLDVEKDPEANLLLQLNGLSLENLPVVITEDGEVFIQPDVSALALEIGAGAGVTTEMYDVVIIGGGPAGLASAVYGASEGLKTLIIERKAPGGQAGTSSRIENYLGFPSGLTGADLSRRAISQAVRLGAEILSPKEVLSISETDNYKTITLHDQSSIKCRAVIITTGVDYKKLEIKGISDFTGAGIYYGAAVSEAASCRGQQVYIVGGGNSAGQSAVYLSKFAKKVHILIRRESLSNTMSSYLIKQIESLPNIEVLTNCKIREASGQSHLEDLLIENIKSKSLEKYKAAALYIFIGAKPFTDWLGEAIERDVNGFIRTGQNLRYDSRFGQFWKLKRDPYLLETSIPGIFAAGDVRSGAMNRIASAVGEGSMAISFVHKYLAEH
ncbi:FAD-dependent oxidoreductase [Pedobacter miscanthi]|uniref:Fused response regulator/thioredoxin-disulfide reductase n=1 Tax=Pedobacter miscanthi TaxID=2259170 RepID=A0A366LD99_9SPHI|nr:FAD-dependent oxidoreductase [Pedobacter miscanthi]RBQ11851.1 fused response regulator/thioredoxin-disulfide reductase [Pedobacter miscanthi]